MRDATASVQRDGRKKMYLRGPSPSAASFRVSPHVSFATGNLTGSTFPGSPTQFFETPSFWEDAVLLLEAVADNP